MYLLELPDDIIIKIVDEMNYNIFTVSLVNKQLHGFLYERIRKAKEKYNRKILFYEKCSTTGTKNLFWNGFHGVTSTEECNFLYTKYIEKFGKENFISRIMYTLRDTYQVPAETWTQWLLINLTP
jgi:hypothetical protein